MVPAMTETPMVEVLELGPGSIRRLWPELEACADHEAVSAAIGAFDDPVVLIGDRPVDVPALWRRLAGSLSRTGAGPLVVVHPSFWSPVRVERVVEGLGPPNRGNGSVVAMRRAQVVADATRPGASDSAEVLIEIDAALIAISEGARLAAVLGRTRDVGHIVDRVLHCESRSSAVLIDAPVGIPGASDYADRICAALSDKGVRASLVSIERIVSETMSARSSCEPRADDSQRRSSGRVRLVVAAAAAAGLCIGGSFLIRTDRLRHAEQPVADGAIVVVEGRISARVPLAWRIEKLTAGPGSRRIRATSTESGGAALHVTQSYIPGQALAGTAEILAGALSGESQDVFRDFDAGGRRAGRAGVSYREVRGTRVIDWFVVVDGATRIGIGCESRSGRELDVRAACDGAIESAHELSGTDVAN